MVHLFWLFRSCADNQRGGGNGRNVQVVSWGTWAGTAAFRVVLDRALLTSAVGWESRCCVRCCPQMHPLQGTKSGPVVDAGTSTVSVDKPKQEVKSFWQAGVANECLLCLHVSCNGTDRARPARMWKSRKLDMTSLGCYSTLPRGLSPSTSLLGQEGAAGLRVLKPEGCGLGSLAPGQRTEPESTECGHYGFSTPEKCMLNSMSLMPLMPAYATARRSVGGSEVTQTPQQDFVFNSSSLPGLRYRRGDLTLLQCPPEETVSPALLLHCGLMPGNNLTAFKMLRILCGKQRYFICWDHLLFYTL